MNGHRLLATTLAIVVVLSALAPLGTAVADEDGAALNVEVTQDDEPVVTVTENGTAVADANVTVSTVDENETDGETYDGVGEYVTDENGTVELPEPESDVEIEVAAVADNRTGSTTATLEADSNETDDEIFGLLVSAFVSGQSHEDAIGLVVANYVLDQNPGNSPIQAGPPGDVGPSSDAGAGNAGPPAHAGGPDDGDDEDSDNEDGSDGEDESDDGDDEKRADPPDHAGGPDDDDENEDDEDDDDETDADDDDETDEE